MFRVQAFRGLGFRVRGSGFRVWVFRVPGLGFRDLGALGHSRVIRLLFKKFMAIRQISNISEETD